MKRKASILTFTAMLVALSLIFASVPSLKAVTAEPQIEWQKTYNPLSGYSVAQTVDGGYAIAGQQAAWKTVSYHGTSGWANKTALLIKVDASGNVEWTKTYDKEVGGGGRAVSVVQTKDEGFAIIGLGFLIKTDAEGNIKWNTTIAWPGGTLLSNGIHTSDEGYLLVGTNRVVDGPNGYGWLVKTDENGNTLWNKTFGVLYSSSYSYVDARVVAEDSDGGYLVAGNWIHDAWFAKLNSDGDVLWNQTYDIQYTEDSWTEYQVLSIAKTVDGGFILAGGNGHRGFLLKTTSEGVMEWNRHYVDGSAFSSIVPAASGVGYFAVGGFGDPYDVWFVRLDSSGDLLWNSTYNISRGDYRHQNAACSVVGTSDGGYAVTGALNSTVWLVKFAPEPPALPDNTSPPPNPVSPQFPTTLIVAIVIIVVAVTVGLLFYFRKRKNKAEAPVA
jgi:hypothetical protein